MTRYVTFIGSYTKNVTGLLGIMEWNTLENGKLHCSTDSDAYDQLDSFRNQGIRIHQTAIRSSNHTPQKIQNASKLES
jgi:hypothetical protein